MTPEIRGHKPITRSRSHRRSRVEETGSVPLGDQSLPQSHLKLSDQFYIKNQQQVYPARYVGSLVVVWRSDLEQFHLLSGPDGLPVSPHRFTTVEHCLSAAMELEETFHLQEAIAVKSSETMEGIAAIIRQHWHREQVGLAMS